MPVLRLRNSDYWPIRAASNILPPAALACLRPFQGKPRKLPEGEFLRGCDRRAGQDGLAPGLFDLFLSGFGELVRVDSDRRGQLAVAEDLDQSRLAAGQAKLLVIVQAYLGNTLFLDNGGDAGQVDDRVFDAEDVGETALGQTAMQRHLATLKTAHQAGAGARSLTFVAAGGG